MNGKEEERGREMFLQNQVLKCILPKVLATNKCLDEYLLFYLLALPT
jgi:hypothetical protein